MLASTAGLTRAAKLSITPVLGPPQVGARLPPLGPNLNYRFGALSLLGFVNARARKRKILAEELPGNTFQFPGYSNDTGPLAVTANPRSADRGRLPLAQLLSLAPPNGHPG